MYNHGLRWRWRPLAEDPLIPEGTFKILRKDVLEVYHPDAEGAEGDT